MISTFCFFSEIRTHDSKIYPCFIHRTENMPSPRRPHKWIPNGIFFGELTNFGDLTILTNHFWCEFLVIIWTTLFSSLLFFQQAGNMPGGATWAGSQNEIMSGCRPSYLKTVSEQVVSRIRTHSLRFLTPNTAILVGIIQIHTNFGCLKWLVKMVKSPKIFVSGYNSNKNQTLP